MIHKTKKETFTGESCQVPNLNFTTDYIIGQNVTAGRKKIEKNVRVTKMNIHSYMNNLMLYEFYLFVESIYLGDVQIYAKG